MSYTCIFVVILFVCSITSRKLGEKEPWSFSHYGSFDHLGLQSLNDYKILFSLCDCKIDF